MPKASPDEQLDIPYLVGQNPKDILHLVCLKFGYTERF